MAKVGALFVLGMILGMGIAEANPDPNLMVYAYGADYHYHASEYYVGDWQYESGPVVQILYDLDGSVSHVNYVTGPYYGPNDMYSGDEGEFVLVAESEDDGWYGAHAFPPDEIVVDLFQNDLLNVYLVATIYESPGHGSLTVGGVLATWDPDFYEADGWNEPGASSSLHGLGNRPAHALVTVDIISVGYERVDFWAFSDENGNGIWDPSEIFSPSSHNLTLNGGNVEIFEEFGATPTKARLLWNFGTYSLNLEGISGQGRVDIYSVQGRRVLSRRFNGHRVDVPLAELPAGIYRVIATVGKARPLSEFIVIP
jgi:hypothetical protein